MEAQPGGLRDARHVPAAASSRDTWPWDLLFLLAGAATGALVAVGPAAVGAKVGAIALVAIGVLGWAAVGRRMAMGDAVRIGGRAAYCVLITAALVGAVLLVPDANWAAFVVLPQLFSLLPLPWAITGTVLITAGLPLLTADTDYLPQVLFMTAFGVLVGVWIHRVAAESEERAQLIRELEKSRAREGELSRLAGAAAERERLAGEIHDTLAQGFTSIVTLLQAAQGELDTTPAQAERHLELAIRSARDNLGEARKLVAAATPARTDASLAIAVGELAERFAAETGVDTAHGTSGAERTLPPGPAFVLQRAAQELLANSARHASARTVTVRLDYREPDAVSLTVADDGVGYDPAAVAGEHFGLGLIRTRAGRIGGQVTVETAPGQGTMTTVRVPS